MQARIIGIALLIVMSLLSACGGSGGSGGAAEPGGTADAGGSHPAAAPRAPGSCDLVTGQEVAAVLGKAVTEVKPAGGLCMYSTADFGPFLSVQVSGNRETRDSFDAYIDSVGANGKVYPVPGIGDAAVYADVNAGGFRTLSLYVLKGQVQFGLFNLENLKGQAAQTQPLPSVRTLALQAASRIG